MRGSRGSGFNVCLGTTTRAYLASSLIEREVRTKGSGAIEPSICCPSLHCPEICELPGDDLVPLGTDVIGLLVDGIPVPRDEMPVTTRMLRRYETLIEDENSSIPWKPDRKRIFLDTHFDLPMSQGFGMSGAGLLSQIIALNGLLDEPLKRETCVALAHEAEVTMRTGLGDIPAQCAGGFTVREREGLPPHGFVHSFPLSNPVILAVMGEGLRSRNILPDVHHRERINTAGKSLVREILRKPTLARMARFSQEFARKCGLLTVEMALLMEDINTGVSPGASMCMLGNSIFVVFPEEAGPGSDIYNSVHEKLTGSAEVYDTSICREGARLL